MGDVWVLAYSNDLARCRETLMLHNGIKLMTRVGCQVPWFFTARKYILKEVSFFKNVSFKKKVSLKKMILKKRFF